jgi:hypothetical protein
MMYEFAGSSEDVVLENDYLSLRFLPDTTEIILTNKSNGVQWRSNPLGAGEDPLADAITQYMMESQFALDYADNSGVGMTLHSSIYSVQRGAYEYEVVDGVLEVRYTVGDIARNFHIPPAMTEERMLEFLEKMEWENRMFVESTYRLYNINNLFESDNRSQLLEDYPDLAKMKLYVLRATTPEYMKEEAEGYFKDAGYTNQDFSEDSERYTVTGASSKPAFSITLRYILDGRSLVVNVPFDKIGFRPVYPITKLDIMPFMGAGDINDNGYMLVPDGSGALIYFNNGRQNQNPYSIDVYGHDEAMWREAILTDDKAPYPAFGIQKNGNALFCVIEEGSAYASIYADVSGRNCSWNRVYPTFSMVHKAQMDIAGRSQRKVFLYEPNLPEGESITLRYTPCAEDGYMGMAKEYRSWLINNYPNLKGRRITESSVPVAVEIVGAVNKTQHRLGLPMDLPLRLTSYKEAESMIKDFAGFGWKNVYVKLNGWFNRSVDHTVPTKIKLISSLGSKRDFTNIISTAAKNNYSVYPEVDFMFMRDVGAFSGFNLYRDAARYVSRDRVQRYPYSFIWFGERKQWGKLNYLSRPVVINRMIDNFMKKASSYGISNIAFRNMGSRLAGDYHDRRHVSREASMMMREQKFDQLAQSGKGILVNGGFVYSVPWASIVTDMQLDDQGYGITDTAIPFYQIVLRGLVPYTGLAINLAEDYTKNLLKSVESGSGLYFSFMAEETAELQETKFRQFYANEYGKWKQDADSLYQRFNADFGHLYNQLITNHTILSPDITITEYEDGTRVVVNLSDNDWNYNGNYLNADSYIVLRRGE